MGRSTATEYSHRHPLCSYVITCFGQRVVDDANQALVCVTDDRDRRQSLGGSSWLTDDDPEQIIWDFTQHLCVLSGKDSVFRETVNRIHIDRQIDVDTNQVCLFNAIESLIQHLYLIILLLSLFYL